jgi:uncharacterized coiled-coil protein SlyX
MRKIKSEELDADFKAFLASLKRHSANSYGSVFRHWINFSGMNGAQTLQFKKDDTDAKTEQLVIKFKAHMINDLHKSGNSARLAASAICGFYSSHRMPLTFTHPEAKRLQEANRSTQDFLFTREDLQKMSEQAAMFPDRYVLLVGKSVGLRAGDFLSFTYGTFRGSHLDSEAPIALGEVATGKEKVKAFPFLDSDSIPIIKQILEANKDKNNNDRILDFVDENSLTGILQRLFQKAGLVSGGKTVRFHNLRKYLIDRLSAVASESQWKQIVGKAISEDAYVSQDQLRDIYLRAMPAIVVNGNSKNHVKIEELETKFAAQEERIQELEYENQALREKVFELDPKVKEKYEKRVGYLRERATHSKRET